MIRALTKKGWSGTRNAVDMPEAAPHRSKKDTRRWCKGKVGREHMPVWREGGTALKWYTFACTTCGKHLDWCYGGFLSRKYVCVCGHHEKPA